MCNCPCMSDCYSCTVLLCWMCLVQCLSPFSQRQVRVGVGMFTHARTTADSVLIACHTVCWVEDKLNCALLLSRMMCWETQVVTMVTHSEGQLLHSPSAERVLLEVLASAPNHLCLGFCLTWCHVMKTLRVLYCWQGQWWLHMVVGPSSVSIVTGVLLGAYQLEYIAMFHLLSNWLPFKTSYTVSAMCQTYFDKKPMQAHFMRESLLSEEFTVQIIMVCN